MSNANAGFDIVRERRAAEKIAVRLDDQANNLTLVNIEYTLLDQIAINGSIEITVVLDIVDMTVNVVIHPARGNSHEVTVIIASIGFLPGRHSTSCGDTDQLV
jgi:hypothetical protein